MLIIYDIPKKIYSCYKPVREERFADSGMRRRHTTQGEEEHEVDVGGEVAGEFSS